MVAETLNKTITFECRIENLDLVREFLNETVSEAPGAKEQLSAVGVAVEEVLRSISDYHDAYNGSNQVLLSIDRNDVRIRFEIFEKENDYQLPDLSDGDLIQFIERQREYELIFFPLRSVMDEINYMYKKGFQNQLELIKFLPSAA
jgi:anti-sigma regulatory factor (Ser/Thr protein kinase)